MENKPKKYRFFKAPKSQKNVPEIRHTKTSVARILKANPLLLKNVHWQNLNKIHSANLKKGKQYTLPTSRADNKKLNDNNPVRMSISSQYFAKNQIKRGKDCSAPKNLRRSKSLENFQKIDEQRSHVLSDTCSVEDLNFLVKNVNMHTSSPLVFDEENKENIEEQLPETDSYENLLIPQN